MKNKPKISVIMSTFNSLPYLKDAVNSILRQSYSNFEFIIVDDASTDKSWEFLSSIKDKRIILIKNSKNHGLALSLNKALRISKGEYIARMDADDISHPKRFEKQLIFLNKNKNIDICGTWAHIINEQGKIVGEKKYPLNDQEIKRSIKWFPALIHPTWMARRKIYNDLKGYRGYFDYAEDYDFLVRALDKYNMANISMKLVYWRSIETRRSFYEMAKIIDADYRVKLSLLKSGTFGKKYLFIIALKFASKYFFPVLIKKKILNHSLY